MPTHIGDNFLKPAPKRAKLAGVASPIGAAAQGEIMRQLSIWLSATSAWLALCSSGMAMGFVSAPTANEIAAANTLAPFQVPQRPMNAYEAPSRGMVTVVEAVNAEFHADNWIVAALNSEAIGGSGSPTPAAWNPYTYIRENWSSERQKQLEPYVRRGDFEIAATPEDVERLAAATAREIVLRQSAAKSDVGSVLGSLLAKLLSVGGFIGGAAGYFGCRLGSRTGGVLGILAGSAYEALLHATLIAPSTLGYLMVPVAVTTAACVGSALASISRRRPDTLRLAIRPREHNT